MENKPEYMSDGEWMIKRTAKELDIPERIVHNVIMHQFQSASNAMSDNNSVEIYGFGKFIFNKKRAVKEHKRLSLIRKNTQKMFDVAPDKRKNALIKRINNLDSQISYLEHKLKEDNENK